MRSYSFTGKVDVNNLEDAMVRIFKDSPYTYELDQNTILIYRPDQQNYRICGSIYDAQSKEPLIAANVVAKGTTIGAESDLSGFFDFEITADKNQQMDLNKTLINCLKTIPM